MKKIFLSLFIVLGLLTSLTGCSQVDNTYTNHVTKRTVPEYTGSPYVVVNDNVPEFDKIQDTDSFQSLSELDFLGRTQSAFACIGKESLPTEKRGDISAIHPSGWHSIQTKKADGGMLYNRCHLIGYQLTGCNDAENLITGTRYLNVDGMLPFENMVADYIKETENHVLYRVTPVYTGDNLLADGVFMEAYSVEDGGEGICYFVFCYNVQPGVNIDYLTGEASDETINYNEQTQTDAIQTFILNTSSKKIHLPTCSGVSKMSEKNKKEVSSTLDDLLAQGYSKCSLCLS